MKEPRARIFDPNGSIRQYRKEQERRIMLHNVGIGVLCFLGLMGAAVLCTLAIWRRS